MLSNFKFFIVGICCLALAGTATAATKGRIMTSGKVTMYKNGIPVSMYTNQGPIDENSLIGCDGTCMVKMQGIALNALDKTLFALKEQGEAVHLFIEKGKIYFVISDISHQFQFYTPNGYYIKTEGFIAPASSQSSVKGFIQVTDQGTEIGMEKGTMLITTDEGIQSINPGQSFVIAMVDVPDEGNNPGSGGAGGRSITQGMTPWQQAGFVALGTGAAFGIGSFTFNNRSSSNNGSSGLSQGSPASPNR